VIVRPLSSFMNRTTLLCLLALGIAGCASPPLGIRAGRPNATEKMMWSTYLIATKKGLATGFVIGRKSLAGSGRAAPVMITAGHLLDSIGSGPLIIAVREPGKSGDAQLALVGVQAPRSGKPFYVRHPREDIGAFAPGVSAAAAGRVLPTFLGENSLGGRGLHAGDDVSFLGFPDLLPGTSGGFPVLRSGKVASYPAAQPHAKGTFLINADVYPGDSGGPVFVCRRGESPELVGMVIERVGRNANSFSHFAIAVDATSIRETLELLADREHQAAAGVKPPRR